jgi:N-acetylglucosamine-6-phosphate deacetylase
VTLTLRGRRYDTGEPICIQVEGDRIASVDPVTPTGSTKDWPWIGPGLVDLQINGHGGIWFSNAQLTPEEVVATVEPHFKSGITRMLPTLVTASHEELSNGFSAIRQACEQNAWVDRMIAGCHLEGPFISGEDGPRGAHPLQHVRPADWGEFQKLQDASGGRIRLVTLAAESEGALEFIRNAVESGVAVAIGHTAANSDEVQAAVDAGARLSTHLGNGAHGQIRRHPNYIWDQLGDSRLMASIITDGIHLPPSVIRSIIRTKTTANVVITCDAAGLAGCPPGEYRAASGNVEILEDGRIVIAGQNQLLAGSSLLTDVCVAHAVAAGGVSLAQAFDMAGKNPCRLLGLEPTRLRRGSRADLVQFDFDGPGDSIRWRSTVMGGEVRFGEIATPS